MYVIFESSSISRRFDESTDRFSIFELVKSQQQLLLNRRLRAAEIVVKYFILAQNFDQTVEDASIHSREGSEANIDKDREYMNTKIEFDDVYSSNR